VGAEVERRIGRAVALVGRPTAPRTLTPRPASTPRRPHARTTPARGVEAGSPDLVVHRKPSCRAGALSAQRARTHPMPLSEASVTAAPQRATRPRGAAPARRDRNDRL